MLEKYAAVRLWFDYIIPLVAIGAVVFGTVIALIVTEYRQKKRIKILHKHGYERVVRGVSSIGGNVFYDWKNDIQRIEEWRIRKLKPKELERFLSRTEHERSR